MPNASIRTCARRWPSWKPRAAAAQLRCREAQRNFRICMTDISEVVLLPGLLDHLRRVAPGVHIETEIISTAAAGGSKTARSTWRWASCRSSTRASTSRRCSCRTSSAWWRGTIRASAPAHAKRFEAEAHAVVSSSGTGHAIVDKTIARLGVQRDVVARLSSFLSVARIVAHTELLVIVPRVLGEVLATQEPVKMDGASLRAAHYAVKQHWHERFHADPATPGCGARWRSLFGQRSNPRRRRRRRRAPVLA
jgi:hypothetical protein